MTVQAQTLGELEEQARSNVSELAWSYLAGGAGEECTLRRNVQAYQHWDFVPRFLTGAGPPMSAARVLGFDVSLPVLTAPFGADGMLHPEGQKAVAQACQDVGTIAVIPASSPFTFEEVAAAAPAAAKVAQVHAAGSAKEFGTLVRRIADCGYEMLCVTVDTPTRGWRDHARGSSIVQDPQLRNANYPPERGGFLDQLQRQTVPTWQWDELEAACSATSLPFCVKGLLAPADAVMAADAGARAVIVSNHGGRQLDGTPTVPEVLPDFVRVAGHRLEIVVDSGIRRASDVAKALCLGASGALVGRLAGVALAAGGRDGVARMLALLQEELLNVMSQLGAAAPDGLDASLVQRRCCCC